MEKCELLTQAERYIPSEDQYLEAFTSIHPTLTSGHQAILAKLYQHCYFYARQSPHSHMGDV
jgi:hypothetical protein